MIEECGKMPKIMIALHTMSQGGADRVAVLLANGFADAGYDVELSSLCQSAKTDTSIVGLVGSNVRMHMLGRRSWSRAMDMVRLLPALARRLRAERPDILISSANNTAWLCAQALRRSGLKTCRLVLKMTNPVIGSRHRSVRAYLRHWGYRRAFWIADEVWTLSDAEKVRLQAAFPESADRFHTVINPYVTQRMLDRHEARPGTPKLVIGIGRLVPQKRFDLLIEAFAIVGDRDARLTILGEGRERQRLSALIASLGLQGRVDLPGFVTDVSEWLARSDLFVLTSAYEGLPAVVLEAMAANCPVLATDCFASARELLDVDGCAIIDPVEPAQLADMIEQSLERPRPETLRANAELYSVENGVLSHLAALSSRLPQVA